MFFLGSYFPKDKVEEITGKSIGPIANANNLWQWNFIHGLGSLKLKLCKYTFPQIGAFPNRYKGIFFSWYIYMWKFYKSSISETLGSIFENL